MPPDAPVFVTLQPVLVIEDALEVPEVRAPTDVVIEAWLDHAIAPVESVTT